MAKASSRSVGGGGSSRRLAVVASHVTGGCQVSFDGGAAWRRVDEPLSRAGRAAYPDAEKSGSVSHYLKVRRAAETGSSPLWRIHDKLYDLEPFLDLHPGGRVWLEALRGTDCTEAFEAHHLDGARAEEALSRYYIRDVLDGEFQCGNRHTYDEAGFWRTVRRRALARLKAACPGAGTMEATGATPAMKAASALVLAQSLACFALTAVTGSPVAAIAAGLSRVGVWGVGHNFMHQAARKASGWERCMDVTPNSTLHGFRITHALSHHLAPNQHSDWEARWLGGNGDFVLTDEKRGGMSMLGLLQVLDRGAVAGRTVTDRVLAPLAEAACLLVMVCGRRSLVQGLLLWIAQRIAHDHAFGGFGLGVHRSLLPTAAAQEQQQRDTAAWFEGQPGGEHDFGAHQVVATTDFSQLPDGVLPELAEHWLNLTLFGYLNSHTLHHLFPAVDHSKLKLLKGVLEQTKAEFGLQSKQRGTWSVWKGFMDFTFRKRVSRL